MKRFALILSILFVSIYAQAQYRLAKGNAQLNAGLGFSGWGVPIYFGFDYGVHRDISVGGELSFRSYNNRYGGYYYNHQIFGISANGNYHFNTLLSIPKEWDFYAGLNLGYYFWSSSNDYNNRGDYGNENSGIGLGAQVGGRYYFNKNWAINLEISGGNVVGGGKIGATYAF